MFRNVSTEVGVSWYKSGTNRPRISLYRFYRRRRRGKAFDGIALRVHVHMGVDIHRDLGARVPGKRLHDLGVHSLAREQREIRMAQLVERPTIEPEALAVFVPPSTQARRLDALAALPGYDGGLRALPDVTLPRMAVFVCPRVALGLRLLMDAERQVGNIGQWQDSRSSFRLGCLEVAQHVKRMVDVDETLIEVDVTP